MRNRHQPFVFRFVFIVTCFFYGFIFGATAQIVFIYDITTMEPLENVMLSGKMPPVYKITDKKGHADVNVFADADTILVERIGFQRMVTSYRKLASDGFKAGMYPASYSLGEIVVSASRFEEKKEDIPYQISGITSTEIRNQNQPTTADLLQNTGNILVQKSQAGGGSPVIRGFEANKVLIVVDGVRMNNAIFRGGHLQNVISVDQAALEKLEVIQGPGSVVYGSDALGGVIHFYTRKPHLSTNDSTNEIHGSAFTRYASASNEQTGSVTFNIGGKRFASLTSASYSRFGDLRSGKNRNPAYGNWGRRDFRQEYINGKDTMVKNDRYNLQSPSGYNQFGLLQKFLFSSNPSTSHLLNFQFTTTNDIPRYDRLTETDANGIFTQAQWYYGPQTRLHTAYEFSHRAEEGLYDRLAVTGAWQFIEESRHNRRFGRTQLAHRKEKLDIFSLNADLEKRIRSHEIRYGTEVTLNIVHSSAYAENIVTGETDALDTRYPAGGSQVYSGGIYLTHTYEFNNKVILTEGIRYSRQKLTASFDDTSFYKLPVGHFTQRSGALSGSIGLVVMPGHHWRMRIIGSTGYRSPNVDDLAKIFESSPGNVIVPNPGLKPEYTYNAEAGISKLVLKKVHIEGTAWYTWYRDAITTGDFQFNGADSIIYDNELSKVKANINAGEAYLYGFSAELNADITRNISLQSTINYTYGRIKTDTTDYPLDHIPPVTGKTAINLSVKQFKGSVYVLYHGFKRRDDYNLVGEDNFEKATQYGTPDWITLNLSGSYRLNRTITIQAAVENIFDLHYRVFASGISAPGRNFIISLRGTF